MAVTVAIVVLTHNLAVGDLHRGRGAHLVEVTDVEDPDGGLERRGDRRVARRLENELGDDTRTGVTGARGVSTTRPK